MIHFGTQVMDGTIIGILGLAMAMVIMIIGIHLSMLDGAGHGMVMDMVILIIMVTHITATIITIMGAYTTEETYRIVLAEEVLFMQATILVALPTDVAQVLTDVAQ